MSSRIFQSVVLQMKDSTDRAIGVIDSEGTVVACNELTCIGEKWGGAVEAVNAAIAELTEDGTVAEIAERYGLTDSLIK